MYFLAKRIDNFELREILYSPNLKKGASAFKNREE